MKPWMIYGANGYSGELIAREAVARGLTPVLAGRSREKLDRLARELKLESRVFTLDDPEAIKHNIKSKHLVLHCAGPFSATAKPMMQACLAAHVNYLDITGEITVFELGASLHEQARRAGIVIVPGVGFDVVPTDCLAAALKQAMPDATHLALGFDSRSGFSPGTAKTSVEGLSLGGRIRENGAIKTVPLAFRTRRIDFGGGEKLAMTIPWGDVSTAYHSTGIPNIEVYLPASPGLVKRLKRLNWIKPLLGLNFVQTRMKRKIERSVLGPDQETRDRTPTHVWGEVNNAKGDTLVGRVTTPNGYTTTMLGALGVAEYLLTHDAAPGFHTPSLLMGPDFVTQLPGVSPITIERE